MDPLNLNDKDMHIRELRRELVTLTWECALQYISEIAAGRLVKPVEEIFPASIRCDMHKIPERLTLYSVDRSTTLTVFHGTGCINHQGRASVKFLVQLISNDFIPVYIDREGRQPNYTEQPFCYIPAEKSGIAQTESFLASIKIR